MPDLLMSVEIPRGSLGVPKHQRDCVPTAKVFHYRVPSFQFPPARKPIPSMNRCKRALKPANFRSLARRRFNLYENTMRNDNLIL